MQKPKKLVNGTKSGALIWLNFSLFKTLGFFTIWPAPNHPVNSIIWLKGRKRETFIPSTLKRNGVDLHRLFDVGLLFPRALPDVRDGLKPVHTARNPFCEMARNLEFYITNLTQENQPRISR